MQAMAIPLRLVHTLSDAEFEFVLFESESGQCHTAFAFVGHFSGSIATIYTACIILFLI